MVSGRDLRILSMQDIDGFCFPANTPLGQLVHNNDTVFVDVDTGMWWGVC